MDEQAETECFGQIFDLPSENILILTSKELNEMVWISHITFTFVPSIQQP
jgi:hypothetical protein